MDAFEICDLLISFLKKSNLHYLLNESPFGVTINIKKKFIRNKDGTLRFSSLNQNDETKVQKSKVQLLKESPPIMQNQIPSPTFTNIIQNQNTKHPKKPSEQFSASDSFISKSSLLLQTLPMESMFTRVSQYSLKSRNQCAIKICHYVWYNNALSKFS